MKFSYRQIAASAAGAVLSAVIASIFGVKGTIVGVAIGSIAATTGTALVFQSIERTNRAVKQVVVRVPDNAMVRRLGGTKASGVTNSEPSLESAVHEEAATSAAATVVAARTATGPVATSERQTSASIPLPPPRTTNLPWSQIVGVVVAVFVVSLLFVTVVELIAGRPLADLFGHGGGGTTVEKIFETPTTTLPPPTSTTTSTSSSTTTSPSSSTTSTVGGTTSSTDGGSTTTSSSTGVPGVSTTTPTG